MHTLHKCLRSDILSQVTSDLLELVFLGERVDMQVYILSAARLPLDALTKSLAECQNELTLQLNSFSCVQFWGLCIYDLQSFLHPKVLSQVMSKSVIEPRPTARQKIPDLLELVFFAHRILVWNYDRHASLHSKCWHIAVILARPHYNQSEYSSIAIKKCSTRTSKRGMYFSTHPKL